MPSILAFGDSNTHGTMPLTSLDDRRRHGVGVRWPSAMAAALPNDFNVIEEGHGGRTTVHDDPYDGEHRNGARILPAIVESHRPLDLVILMLGTNDLKGMFNVTPFEIGLSVEKLCKIIRLSECGVDGNAPGILIVSPPPIIETGLLAELYLGGQAKGERLAQALENAAERSGTHFFDAGKVAEVDPVEGVHFDAENHIALGQALAAQVIEILG